MLGSTVVQQLALWPHSEEVLGVQSVGWMVMLSC